MKPIADELSKIVADFEKKFEQIPDHEFSAKPVPNKWSKKEVVGHLIDSAHNNLRRFVVAQYESAAPKIVYDQDFWVQVNNYQAMSKSDVVKLWSLMNQRIVYVLGTMEESKGSRQADTGKAAIELHTLDWLGVDYVKHLKHHLNQIVPMSFDVIYN